MYDKVEFCQPTYILCISKNLLLKSCTNNRIFSIISNCPSLAVNIACIAITPTALQRMLYVSYEYSRKWHFSFNAQKVCILQVRSKGSELDFDCIWKLVDTIIPGADNYNHIGIVINNKLTVLDRILSACQKRTKSTLRSQTIFPR